MTLSFPGGVHPEEMKLTAKNPIQKISAPAFVRLPLLQHIGSPAVPVVSVGDRVLKGQVVAREGEGLSVAVHSPVSGVVVAREKGATPKGDGELIVIENDYKDEIDPSIVPFSTPIFKAEPEEIEAWIREKGIVGLGGAAFPTYAKIRSARGAVDRFVINCAECEPYLTANHRLLLECTDEVVGGAKILMRAMGISRGVFAIEDNKEDAADALYRFLGDSKNFQVAVLKTKYPQGDERQLTRALFGKEIPRGKLPRDVGVVFFNAETCWAVYRAFVAGLPAIERIVTVSGDCVKEPQNLLVSIGTSFKDVFQFCGGFSEKPDRIIAGGPMMGQAQWTLDVPVTKGVGGLLAKKGKLPSAGPCIHCGRCVKVCPMGLMPLELNRAVAKKRDDDLAFYSVNSCSECGSCTFICPAKIPLLQNIRIGKDRLRAVRRSSES